MAAFSRWYISRLKSHPMLTNMGSALVLMASGDVMAQELERNHFHIHEDEEEIENTPRLSLKRYGTVNPTAAQTAAEVAFEKRKHEHDPPPKHHPNNTSNDAEEKDENDAIDSTNSAIYFDDIKDTITYAVDTLRAECEYLDGYRTTTMMAWSAGAYTPLYVAIYKVCDRFMPHQTPVTVTARVALSFLLSVPINAGFFTYGTFVHHTMEWMAIQNEWKMELEELGILTDTVQLHGESVVPYDWEMLHATARLKLESELLTTVVDSAKVWIPVNFLNFTLVPPHLRPVVLLTLSVFWNAYLSLAQHRDLSLPEDEEPEEKT